MAEGDVDSAEDNWWSAADIDPTGYYSARATDLLAGRDPFSSSFEADFDIDWEQERAIAEASDPIRMAYAMRLAVESGRLAYLAGRMAKKRYADPSSPLAGLI